jgi:hypothetical protein
MRPEVMKGSRPLISIYRTLGLLFITSLLIWPESLFLRHTITLLMYNRPMQSQREEALLRVWFGMATVSLPQY